MAGHLAQWLANWWLLPVAAGIMLVQSRRQTRWVASGLLLGSLLVLFLLPVTWLSQNHRRLAMNLDVVRAEPTAPAEVSRTGPLAHLAQRWPLVSKAKQQPVVLHRVTESGEQVMVRARRQSNRKPAAALERLLGAAPTITVPSGTFGGAAGCVVSMPLVHCAWADHGTVGVLSFAVEATAADVVVTAFASELAGLRDSVEIRRDRYHPYREAATLVLTLLAGAVGLLASLVAHELAHAAMARFVGAQLHGICIGSGALVWHRTVRGVDFSLRKVPIGGYVQCSPRSPVGYRVRQASIWAAGPAANLFIAVFMASIWGPGHLGVLVNVGLFVANAMPYSKFLPEAGRRIGTDGYQFREIIQGRKTYQAPLPV
jgi:Peptidase family M50